MYYYNLLCKIVNRERIYAKLEESDCCNYLYTKNKEVIKRLQNKKNKAAKTVKRQKIIINEDSESESENEEEEDDDEDSVKIFDKYMKKINVAKIKENENNNKVIYNKNHHTNNNNNNHNNNNNNTVKPSISTTKSSTSSSSFPPLLYPINIANIDYCWVCLNNNNNSHNNPLLECKICGGIIHKV